MKNRLKTLLCNVVCKGDDRREGGCGLRKDDRCDRIERLDMCMIECIADHLLAEGVIVPPVKIGQTVYAVLGMEIPPSIYSWQVRGVAFMENKWYAVERDGSEWEIGRECCLLTREEAEKALAERSGQ